MANKKLVKLGDKAEFFFDAGSRIKVLPGQVVELGVKSLGSVRIQMALKNGHLVVADSKEFEAQNEASEVEETGKLSKKELQAKAKELGTEYSASALRKLSEEELEAHIADLEAEAGE